MILLFGHHDEIYSDKKLFNEFFKSKKTSTFDIFLNLI